MKKILIAVTAVFFAGMLVLTFTARTVHNAGLPHISAARVQTASFPVEGGFAQALAVTTEQYEQGVYLLYKTTVNGEQRDFIRRAEIVPGQEYEGFVEVVSGLSLADKIVVESDRELREGEVVVVSRFEMFLPEG